MINWVHVLNELSSAAVIISSGGAAWTITEAFKSRKVVTAISGTVKNRWHRDITPNFTLELEPNEGTPYSNLKVSLDDDFTGLVWKVTFEIQDEKFIDHRARGCPNGVKQEEFDRQIWGPWEFNTGASAQVEDNRRTISTEFSSKTKNWTLLSLERTSPPSWNTHPSKDNMWSAAYKDQPLRIKVTCECDGYDPWTFIREISATN